MRASAVFDSLAESAAIRDYLRAFSILTGLGATLVPITDDGSGLHFGEFQSPYCEAFQSCADRAEACRLRHRGLLLRVAKFSKSVAARCPTGVVRILYPIVVKGSPVALLAIGQFVLNRESGARRIEALVANGAVSASDVPRLTNAWEQTRRVDGPQFQALQRMFEIVAERITAEGDRMAVYSMRGKHPAIIRLERFIPRNLGTPLRLPLVAKAVGVSPNHLSILLKRFTGQSYVEYIRHARILAAKRRLQNPGIGIAETAFAVGFSSLATFNRAFRAVTGVTPSEFRKS